MIVLRRHPLLVALIAHAACGGPQADHNTSIEDRRCLATEREKIANGAHFQASPAPPAAPGGPIVVPPNAIAGKRTFGRISIVPDDDTRMAMQTQDVTRTCPWFKLCLDERGVPTNIEVMRTSCFPRYDEQIVNTMYEWRYSPFMIDGAPVKVCTSVTLCYGQHR